MFYYEFLKIDETTTAKFLKSSLLEGIEHFFSTRDFVLSAGSCEDLRVSAISNRKKLCKYFNIETDKLFVPNQTHSANIKILPCAQKELEDTDGLISGLAGSAMLLNFADCTPIIIFDPQNNVGAIVHAGWRATAQSIASKAVKMMTKNFGSQPQSLICAIGPSIGACCYCVDEEVYYKIKKTIKTSSSLLFGQLNGLNKHKYYVDLKKVNFAQLREAGVKNIDVTKVCTSCENGTFFSYRKENGHTARHSAVLKINASCN